jgi:hypothetical protein
MEYNRGRLIPTGIDPEIYSENPDELDDLLHDNGLVSIDGEIYQVEWQNKREQLYGFQRVKLNDDGSIDFETYHYNGGGHWTECVESALGDLK